MPSHLDAMVTALVPSLARSLAEQFNVFRVMHHGTHEKQLSNVFAWLLDPDATHHLNDVFQRLFVARVNRSLEPERQLPVTGYTVTQEVNTSAIIDDGRDIADIVLTSEHDSIVIENYEVSDGHGHSYDKYLAHGSTHGRRAVVVLLCVRHQAYLMTAGWENAVVVTYAELLEDLRDHIKTDRTWKKNNPRQHFFIRELIQHFTKGPAAVSTQDQIAFLKAMCENGESARYGQQRHDLAAQEFADLLALHAKRLFEEGRRTLADVKAMLRGYAQHTLIGQLNAALPTDRFTQVRTPYAGRWQWSVVLERTAGPNMYLEFGPTAVAENGLVTEPVADPDYSKIFVTRQAPEDEGIDLIIQTDVGMDEVIASLAADDFRLRDALLAAIDHRGR